jgi:hypothetical protein
MTLKKLLLPWVVIVSTCLIADRVMAQEIPLPRPRPSVTQAHAAPEIKDQPATTMLVPPQEAYASLPEPVSSTAASEPSACQRRLTPDLAVIHPLPPIVGPGDCGAADVVRLEAIMLPDRSRVSVTPAATLRCSMAEAIINWVRDDVAPALAELESPLRTIENYDSFECRGRNRVVGAKVSEHGLANALDIKSFKLANGAMVEPTDINVDKAFRVNLRQSACSRFMTVLGPGSDGYHESHIHVDLAERRNNYRVCQWDVREPPVASASDEDKEGSEDAVPLPRPRPLEADAPHVTGTHSKL